MEKIKILNYIARNSNRMIIVHALFCSTALPLYYSRYNKRVARSARRRKSDHLANTQLVGTNVVSAAMFLVIRRKI